MHRETSVFAHCGTSTQLKLFLELFDVCNCRKEMNLSILAPIVLRRLSFLEINEDGKIHAGIKIPIHERFVRPAIGAAHDDIFPRILKVLRSQRFHRLELEAVLVEDESQASRLHREQGGEERNESAADHAPHSLIGRDDGRSDDAERRCQRVVGVDNDIRNLWFRCFDHGIRWRRENALKK